MSSRPPADSVSLFSLVRQSGLVSEERLKQFVAAQQDQSTEHAEAGDLLAAMVAAGMLTDFQASQLSMGRWRGLVLNQYTLLDRLGGGGMGQVFLGQHQTLGRRVAIKVLAARLADDPVARERLVREAKAAAALDHPNIVRVFDIDTEHSPPYLVMEYLEGLSLQAAVALSGTFQAGAAALCGRQVALALQHAFEMGLVHRDVKPANLIIDRLGQVKLLDLGIVRSMDTPGLTISASGGKLILGTIDYLSPEQADDCSNVDTRADIYSLGATLYFLLAGGPPFPEGTAAARLTRKREESPTPIHQLRPDVPEGLSDVIARMLARDPAERYQMPRHAAEALTPWAVPVAGFPDDLFQQTDSAVAGCVSNAKSSRASGICKAAESLRGQIICDKTIMSEAVPENTVVMTDTKIREMDAAPSRVPTPAAPPLTMPVTTPVSPLSHASISAPLPAQVPTPVAVAPVVPAPVTPVPAALPLPPLQPTFALSLHGPTTTTTDVLTSPVISVSQTIVTAAKTDPQLTRWMWVAVALGVIMAMVLMSTLAKYANG